MRIFLWILAIASAGGTGPHALMAQAAGAPTRRLTLTEARSQARETSPELARAREALRAAAGRERQAAAWSNPALAFHREETSRAGETTSQSILSVEQRLELWGPRGARRNAAGLEREAAEARLAAATARLDFEVTRAYVRAVAATRAATLADEAAQAFARARRVSEARLAGGDVSGYQHRRLLLEATRYATLRSEAMLARDSALGALSTLTGSQTTEPFVPDSLAVAPLDLSGDSVLSLAMRSRADLRALELEADAADAGVRAASAERLPRPVLTAGYKSERLPTGESLDGFVAGVSLPLPVWDRRSGAIDAARGEAGGRRAVVALARRHAGRDVRDAYAAHQTLAAELAALASPLGDEARRARVAAQASYAEGEISLLEWLDTVRAYHEAESTYLRLWSEYVTRRAALERLTGLRLF